MHIETGLYRRQGKAITNFKTTLPAPQSDLAQQLLNDPYNFDFLTLSREAHERDLEKGLIAHIRQFLVELGVGFAFAGSQVLLNVGGEEFFIDLLFYHFRLRRFVVIDLKMTPFKPAYAGQMNFYRSAIDDLMRHPDDQPSIGLILCKNKNQVAGEYAVRDIDKPLGIAESSVSRAWLSSSRGRCRRSKSSRRNSPRAGIFLTYRRWTESFDNRYRCPRHEITLVRAEARNEYIHTQVASGIIAA